MPETLRETVHSAVVGAEAVLVYHGSSAERVAALAAAGRFEVLLIGGLATPDLAAMVRRVRRHLAGGYVVAIRAGRRARPDDDVADLLALGAAGADAAVDLAAPGGPGAVRAWVDRARRGRFGARVVRRLLAALHAPSDDGSRGVVIATRLLEAAFAPEVRTARDLAARLGIPPTTLSTRLARSRLPTAKQFVEEARLCWAAHWAEEPGRSAADVARALGEPSAQGLRRWVRRLTRLAFEQFRAAYDSEAAVDRYEARLVRPAAATLRDLDRTFPTWSARLAQRTA